MNDIYKKLPEDYYYFQYIAKTSDILLNFTQKWFKKRQELILGFVRKYVPRNGLILDVGCGNSVWNNGEISTVGLDLAHGMLRHNTRRISSYVSICADFNIGLPFSDESFDCIVVTEVLEHVVSYFYLIQEVHRVLKHDGIVIVSVPYENFPGLWGILFPLWCRYRTYRYHEVYYAKGCGHCVSFNLKNLNDAFKGFSPVESRHLFLLTLFYVARRIHGSSFIDSNSSLISS